MLLGSMLYQSLSNFAWTWGGFVEHLGLTKVAQQSVTQFIVKIDVNFATPKVAAKQQLLFNKPASVL